MTVSAETTQALVDVARLIAAGILGGLIATYAGHRLAVSRERDSERRERKREFRNFIARLKADSLAGAYRKFPNISSAQSFAVFHRQKKHELRAAAGNVENDFGGKRRAEFDGLVNTAVGFTSEEIIANGGMKRVVDSLDAILRFLDR